MTRSDRQDQAVQKWVEAKLKGTIVASVGFGKTRLGMLAINRFLAKNKTKKVIIVVPSDPIKQQWISETVQWKVFDNCSVKTMHDVSNHEYSCDLLVIDELHKSLSSKLYKMYENIKYKAILGLTATFNRLDGRHELLTNICPVIDTITAEEAIEKGWMSKYKEYLILINPTDYEVYSKLNQEFNEHFAYFNYDFGLSMKCATDWKARANLAKQRCNGDNFKEINSQILIHAIGFNRCLQSRKKYINSHPRKLELAEMILEHRMDKKCITFSNTIAMAEKIKYGKVYSGKDSNKKGRITLQEFMEMDSGVLNTVMKLKEGYNDPQLSVAINLGINSSETTNIQKRGRTTRVLENKEAEVFYLVLNKTVEMKWFQNCIGNKEYITIDENELINVLENREFNKKKNKETSMIFRF